MITELQIRDKGTNGYGQRNSRKASKVIDFANLAAGTAASVKVLVPQNGELGDFVLASAGITLPAHAFLKGEASQQAITSVSAVDGLATATLAGHGLLDATNTKALCWLNSANPDFRGLKTLTYVDANSFTFPVSEHAATAAQTDVTASIVTLTLQNVDDATAMDLASATFYVLVL